jgi:ribonuclease BN (tRNA processing enzyme)
MKLKFAGVGNAFACREHYQSNAVVELDNNKLLLIDCGTDARFSVPDAYPFINNSNVSEYIKCVYISHLHADHMGGLEWIAFTSLFGKNKIKPKLIIPKGLKDPLWDCLKGCLEITDGKILSFDDFFDINEGVSFTVKDLKMRCVESIHVKAPVNKKSYGLFMEGEVKTYYTSDVIGDNYSMNQRYYEMSDQIFHDCETTPYKSGVHAHYDELKQLPEYIKNKMWLYHYSDDAKEKYNPKEDGFMGFVERGTEYSI